MASGTLSSKGTTRKLLKLLKTDRLREMETGAVRGDGLVLTWDNYCDGCPCYNDGFGSGFWIEISEVEAFKAAWKIAKKEPK